MNYLVHATPVHPSLCLQYLILLFTIDIVTVFILLLLLLFYYCHHYKTIVIDKPLQASLFLGAAELTTHLSRFINILWLPLCQINKFGFYFPRRLLRSPILVGHQGALGLGHGPNWAHGGGRPGHGCPWHHMPPPFSPILLVGWDVSHPSTYIKGPLEESLTQVDWGSS
jgi:hypothetical protein